MEEGDGGMSNILVFSWSKQDYTVSQKNMWPHFDDKLKENCLFTKIFARLLPRVLAIDT